MSSGKLTPQQRLFCYEYLVDLNATQAAIRAGYSEKTATVQGSQMMAMDKIKEELQTLMKPKALKLELNAESVLKELKNIGFADLGKAYDNNGRLLPIHEIPEEVRVAIAGIKVFEEYEGFGQDRVKVGEVREVKFWDKPKSLELLGKYLKLFTEKLEVSGKVTLEQLVAGSKEEDPK